MPTNTIAAIDRQRFYDQQVLTVNDFEREQAFHLLLRELANRVLLNPGVLSGLTVEATADGVLVRPGAAIDAKGRIVLLTSRAMLDQTPLMASADGAIAIPLNVEGRFSLDRSRTWHLTIAFAEMEVANTRNRMAQAPILSFTEQAPDPTGAVVVLAKVTVVATATTTTTPTTPPTTTTTIALGVTVDSSVAARATLVDKLLPRVDASKINGVLAAAQIPALDASTIIGTLDVGLLPDIPPEKIGGVLDVAQIPRLPASKLADGSLGNAVLTDRAVDGRVIDPHADVALRSLTVNGRDVLAELDALKAIVTPPPRRMAITAVTSPIYPEGELTITGTGFGTGEDDESAVVTYGDRAAVPGPFRDDGRNYVTAWRDDSITLSLLGAEASGTLTVTARGVTSDAFPYTVLAVQIASAARSSGTSDAPVMARATESITITGYNFGSVAGTIEFPTLEQNGSRTNGTVTSWSNTSILVRVPADAGNGMVQVVPVNFPGWRQPSFRFEMIRPAITTTSPGLLHSDDPAGGLLTITGANFGAHPGQVMLSGHTSLVLNPTTWSDTEITVHVPGAANAIQYLKIEGASTEPLAVCDLIVTTAEGASNPTYKAGDTVRSFTSIRIAGTRLLYLFDGEPFGVGVHNSIDAASPGAHVVLSGDGSFGNTPGTVALNGVAVAPLFWSAQEIQIRIPSDATSGYLVITPVDKGPSNGKYLDVL